MIRGLPLYFILLMSLSNLLVSLNGRHSNQLVSLKVRVGRPNGARERYIVGSDREGTTDVTGVLGPCSYLARFTKPRKIRALPRAHVRQGKETVHLVGKCAL